MMTQESHSTMWKVAVVIDNGCAFSRAGFAGEETPRIVTKTTCMPPPNPMTFQDKQSHLAYTVHSEHSTQKIHPLRHGIIVNWEAMENLWSHIFCCGLKVPTEEHPVLISDSPSCPTTNKEKIAEVLFEIFGVPALHVANTGFLSLCSYGRVTGLAVEAGAGVSHVTPVYTGRTWKEGTHRLDVAGRALCKYLHTLLLDSSNNSEHVMNLDRKAMTQFKKRYCYVSMDYEQDLCSCEYQDPVNIEIQDGHLLKLGRERFCCPEPLFRPYLLKQDSPGLHHLTIQSLQKVPYEFKRDIMNNVVLSGGSSLFPGFPERMRLELDAFFHGKGSSIRILTSPKRGMAAWLGGSLATSLSSFHNLWMSKEDYQEHGAVYVHEKF